LANLVSASTTRRRPMVLSMPRMVAPKLGASTGGWRWSPGSVARRGRRPPPARRRPDDTHARSNGASARCPGRSGCCGDPAMDHRRAAPAGGHAGSAWHGKPPSSPRRPGRTAAASASSRAQLASSFSFGVSRRAISAGRNPPARPLRLARSARRCRSPAWRTNAARSHHPVSAATGSSPGIEPTVTSATACLWRRVRNAAHQTDRSFISVQGQILSQDTCCVGRCGGGSARTAQHAPE
jgi:hypothetical protein